MKTLMVIGAWFIVVSTPIDHCLGQNWTLTSAPATNWSCVASSADGAKLAAAVSGGLIYTSTNSGALWSACSAPAGDWHCIASSADGARLVAGNESTLFVSSDSGFTWTSTTLSNTLFSVAISSDGTIVTGMVQGGTAISTNSGADWAYEGPPHAAWDRFFLVAGSGSGKNLALAGDRFLTIGFVYFATNTFFAADGAVTTLQPEAGYLEHAGQTAAIALSADASKVSILFNDVSSTFCPGTICCSLDSGVTWMTNCEPVSTWTSLACSADGTRLIALAVGDTIYTSSNAGFTWTAAKVPKGNWYSAASSADGATLVAAMAGGGIYTWQSTPVPLLGITVCGTNAILSWTLPSKHFALQNSSNLLTVNWMDVSDSPVLDYSTLRNQVVVPVRAGATLYRLASR